MDKNVQLNQDTIIDVLRTRFLDNPKRHIGVDWLDVESKLVGNKKALKSLLMMEESGGEPDVVKVEDNGDFVFMDCSKETPKGRRNCCYDEKSRVERKKYPPETDALTLVKNMGTKLLDEADYRYLQSIEAFDTKTSSWLVTPPKVRKLGGALFGDNRFDTVFIYHNGADSYYGARGFRVKLVV